MFSTLVCFVLLSIALPSLPGCAYFNKFKPAPIAEGHDAIVVNAERAQRSTLDVYEMVVVWEEKHRAILPAEVSRAVDSFRKEFPPAWKESRAALKQYKAGVGPNSTDMQRVTAALLVAQERLLALKKDADPNQAIQAMNSLSQLIHSVGILMGRTTPTQ